MKAKQIMPFVCLTTLLTVGLSHGQVGRKKEQDARVDDRVRKILDDNGDSFKITSQGDFRILKNINNGRTQILIVNSNTEKYRNMEIREIWSVAYVADSSLPSSTMRTLLKDNENKKLGSWKIVTSDGKEYAVFYAQIAADSDKESFFDTLQIVSQAADEMEKQLTGKDDL